MSVCNLSKPLVFVPASHEHLVPTKWQVRSVLGDCISKAKVISIRAPQYRQYVLTCDFLDFALAQGPTGSTEASKPCLAHFDRPSCTQSSTTTFAGPLVNAPEREIQDRRDVSDSSYQKLLAKRRNMATVAFVLGRGTVSNPWR